MTRTLRMWGVAAFLMMVVGWGVGQTSSWPPGPEHAVVKLWPKGVRTATVAKGPEVDTSTALMAGSLVKRWPRRFPHGARREIGTETVTKLQLLGPGIE